MRPALTSWSASRWVSAAASVSVAATPDPGRPRNCAGAGIDLRAQRTPPEVNGSTAFPRWQRFATRSPSGTAATSERPVLIGATEDAAHRLRRNSAGSGSRLTTRKASCGKSKKNPGWTSTPSRSSSSSDELLFGARRRHTQHRRPARVGGEQPRRTGTVRQRRSAASLVRTRSRIRCARPRPPRAAGAATWTGVETDRYVSQISSSRSSASEPADRARPRAIQPSFTCGSPTDFDSPPRRNVRRWRR